MTEEIKDARKQAPRAIVMSVYIGSITGFVFLISLCFCIGDIETTATSPTGVPLIEIFFNSTGSVGGSCALTSLIVVICLFCANSLMAEGSRAVFAFARDHGLPFSGLFSKVDPKKQVPIFAILLTALVQIAFNSIYFGTLTGFNTIISIATEGFCRCNLPSSFCSQLIKEIRRLLCNPPLFSYFSLLHGFPAPSRRALRAWQIWARS
jgi:choline transport protein